MKRIALLAGLVLSVGLVAALGVPNAHAEEPAVTLLCHLPPGNPGKIQTITVGASAVPAHLAHGDTLGGDLLGGSVAAPASVNGDGKVTICHNHGSGDRTLSVAAEAVPAHLNNHGDTIGPCP